ncbi:class I SAM-dependent methyltransferase [Pleurocapsales cyanobacterium LEGE 06147]|nr:class I SAM-dependent methyltransferase [Pleurocapsales cyanobacterium LEGE 06147]
MKNTELSNSQALKKIIFERIATSRQQRITFAEYMNLVLYHPQYGYYSSGVVGIGAKGDYFTSVSLGQDFGELLASQFAEMWQLMGCPRPFSLVEMGAGNGRLAVDICNYLQAARPDLLETLEYIIVEEARELINRQQQLFQELLPNKKINCNWKSWQEIPENSLTGCCFSNELVDAFPVHQIIIRGGELQEVYLTETQGELTETYGEVSRAKLADYFKLVGVNLPNKNFPENYRTEVNLAALDWLKIVTNKLQKGYLLTIDYGYPATKYYHPQRSQGTLQCYYHHRRHNDPYINLGYQDLTAHVDFTALERQGELLGLEKIGFTQQGLFLMALGLGDRLNELSSGKYNILQVMQRRDALHQLVDPMGLGGFGILVQGKELREEEKLLKGLTVPPLF